MCWLVTPSRSSFSALDIFLRLTYLNWKGGLSLLPPQNSPCPQGENLEIVVSANHKVPMWPLLVVNLSAGSVHFNAPAMFPFPGRTPKIAFSLLPFPVPRSSDSEYLSPIADFLRPYVVEIHDRWDECYKLRKMLICKPPNPPSSRLQMVLKI